MNRGIKFAPFCVLATILTASCPARANTIIFQCGASFAVDLKNNTVNNQPATINATAIDWHLTPGPADDTGVVYYHIDRSQQIGARHPLPVIREKIGPPLHLHVIDVVDFAAELQRTVILMLRRASLTHGTGIEKVVAISRIDHAVARAIL